MHKSLLKAILSIILVVPEDIKQQFPNCHRNRIFSGAKRTLRCPTQELSRLEILTFLFPAVANSRCTET